MIKKLYTLFAFGLLTCMWSVHLSAQNFTCNNQINVTVNSNCAIDLTVDAMLEGDTDNDDDVVNGLYTYHIFDITGTVIVRGGVNGPTFGGDDMSAYVNSYLAFRVFYAGSGNYCEGVIKLEDKEAPTIDCQICPEINGSIAADYDPECILGCFDQPVLQLRYDDGLRDDLVQEDFEDFADDAMSDNCNNWNVNQVSHYDTWDSGGACIGTVLKRTWTVGYTKANGTTGAVTCTREYFFQPFDLSSAREYDKDAFGNSIVTPILDSIILPVSNIVVPCASDVSPAGIAAYFDNPLTIDRDTDDNNIDPDELDVDLVIENNEGIAYGYPHFYQQGVGPGGPHAQAIKEDVCNIIVGSTDNEIEVCGPGCGGNRKILRNWTILDWCSGQFIFYGQIIKAVDTAPPTLDIPALVVSVDPWNCEANINLPFPEHLNDLCDPNPKYRIGKTGGLNVAGDQASGYILINAGLGTHNIEYITEDCCGNLGSSYVNITVVDNTPPVAVSKEFIVIGLTSSNNPVDELQGSAKVFAQDIDNGSYDGCTGVSLAIRRDANCSLLDAEWGPFVTFCCEDLNGAASKDIKVELRITDQNGNSNQVWATVKLEDKSGAFPVIPPHMFLTCDVDYNDFNFTGGLPKFYGACGEATVDCDTLEVIDNTVPRELRLSDGVVINGIPQQAPAYNPSCGFGAVRRQFRDCGGGEQWFVILPLDPFNENSIDFPSDIVVDCDNYDVGEPTWLEATCNLVGVTLESDTFLFEDGACFKILNHWSVINWCEYDPTNPSFGGRYDWTQVIKLVDTQDPILTVQDSLCFGVLQECSSEGITMQASAVDQGLCSSKWLSWEVTIDIDADWTEDYNYSAVQPRLQANGTPNPYYLPKTANGQNVTVKLPDGIYGSKIWHRSIWRAFDGCGNTVSATRYFQVADKKAPTPYCLNLSTAVMENGNVELWAIDFNVGSFDNCTNSENIIFTFTDIQPPVRSDEEYDSNSDLMWYDGSFWYYNSEKIDITTGAGEYEKQDDYAEEVHKWDPSLRSSGKIFTIADADSDGFAQVPVYAWDECGNIDFCVVSLRLIDNDGGGQAMVAGQIMTEFGSEVENVMTTLRGPLNYSVDILTNNKGEFAFGSTPYYADYMVFGTKNDDYLNGVSTLDLVLMQRHILGQQLLDSPYKMIAADVNNDNSVSAIDMLELRKLILGIYEKLPKSGSWKFINAEDKINVSAPWEYNQEIFFDYLQEDKMGSDFVGVKMGDVNSSVVANLQSSVVDSRSAKTIALSYDSQKLTKDQIFEVNLSYDGSDLFGYQFTLSILGLEFLGVSGQSITDSNVSQFGDMIAVSCNNSSAYSADNNLISFKFKSNVEADVLEVIKLNSDLVSAEAYVGKDLEIVNLALNTNLREATFALYQNEPNPFNDFTVISFDLPTETTGKLSLYDVTGKVLKVIERNFVNGRNSLILSKEDFNATGVIYYKLVAGENTAIRNMILVD